MILITFAVIDNTLLMINVNDFLSNGVPGISTPDISDYTDIIDSVKACSRVNHMSYVLVDYDMHHPIYMSENLLYIDEALLADFKRPSENPYWSLVSDNTLELLSHVHDDYSHMRDMMSKEEYLKHLCIMDYPITIKGKEFFINSRFTPLRMREDGITKLGLFSFSPSSKKEMSFLVITSSGKRWSYDFEARSFQEFNLDLKLTIAEKAILQRARKGMSNEEIADDLYLSLNTVKSHKMHIFKKLNVSNITEALVVIGNYQLL